MKIDADENKKQKKKEINKDEHKQNTPNQQEHINTAD